LAAAARIAIEGVDPEIDGGRFPAKAVSGRKFVVEADIFGDGHDVIAAALLSRTAGDGEWTESPMHFIENDRWQGQVVFPEIGAYEYTLIAWRDLFASWHAEIRKKIAAGQDVSLEIEEGRALVEAARNNAAGEVRRSVDRLLKRITSGRDDDGRLEILLDEDTTALMQRATPRTNLTRYDHALRVIVDRPKAAFSAWYEMMPRSQAPGRHGNFRDVIDRLPYVRDLGFDVLYFPPIHPIGRTNRKGRNNSLEAIPADPGSPYAIGSTEGGHDAIHPELGTFEDFEELVAAAREQGLEIALGVPGQFAKVGLQFVLLGPPREISIGLGEAELGQRLHHLGTGERFGQEQYVGVA
jgi:starch synthase (maltosyl-transferring)